MSEIAVNAITDASGGSTASINGYTPTVSNMAGRNKILNGAMVIDQRNAGASVTLSNAANNFITDRFQTYKAHSSVTITGQQSSVAPTGFSNSLLFTTTTGAAIGASDQGQVRQSLEGFNISDLAWGTANAKPVTVSFWVRSSLTGNFAIAIQNPGLGAVYVSTYTVSSANTFEFKTITISGPTSGTFGADNTLGFALIWDLGAGSNFDATANTWTTGNKYTVAGTQKVMGTSGATFYLTGVQLEAGSVATPFEHRQYGQELALCQRYYEICVTSVYSPNQSDNYGRAYYLFKTTKRATPTIVLGAGGVGSAGVAPAVDGIYCATSAGAAATGANTTASAEL